VIHNNNDSIFYHAYHPKVYEELVLIGQNLTW